MRKKCRHLPLDEAKLRLEVLSHQHAEAFLRKRMITVEVAAVVIARQFGMRTGKSTADVRVDRHGRNVVVRPEKIRPIAEKCVDIVILEENVRFGLKQTERKSITDRENATILPNVLCLDRVA